MTLIEGIGDEVTHFFLILFTLIIIVIAWRTTSISEQRHVRTVLLLDRRRRISRRLLRRLTNHTETVTVSEGSPQPISENDQEINEASPESNVGESEYISSTSNLNEEQNNRDSEENTIIKAMDMDQCEIKRRKPGNNSNNTDVQETNVGDSEGVDATAEISENLQNELCITVKLKYINDEIRTVDGKLDEQLGQFRRRHFQSELIANKIIRLIFNGQVLQQDHQTLQSCGFFDNCVVHCLVHQKRDTGQNSNAETRENNVPASNYFRESIFIGVTNNNNQGREWDLGNILFGLISFILLGAWYFRYVYAHLYTVTATVGLILITGIFTIVSIGMYFPDNDVLPNPNIQIARAERPELNRQ